MAARHYRAFIAAQGPAQHIAEQAADIGRQAIPVGWDARQMRGHGPNGLATASERQAAQAPRFGSGKPREGAALIAEPKHALPQMATRRAG